jgi:hypothetical protein
MVPTMSLGMLPSGLRLKRYKEERGSRNISEGIEPEIL